MFKMWNYICTRRQNDWRPRYKRRPTVFKHAYSWWIFFGLGALHLSWTRLKRSYISLFSSKINLSLLLQNETLLGRALTEKILNFLINQGVWRPLADLKSMQMILYKSNNNRFSSNEKPIEWYWDISKVKHF